MTQYELARAIFSAINELAIRLTGEPIKAPVILDDGAMIIVTGEQQGQSSHHACCLGLTPIHVALSSSSGVSQTRGS